MADLVQESSAPQSVYAVLSASGQQIGVDAAAVVQVIPRPEVLASLPRAHQTLAGVVAFRGMGIPVVDLAQWRSDPPGADLPAPGHIAVLSSGSHWIGLLIDAVSGLARVAPGDIQRLHHDESLDEFFQSVAAVGPERKLLGLLDADRLMRQARVWSDAAGAELSSGASSTPAGEDAGSAGCFAVVQIGECLFGFPATALAEVLPRPALQTVLDSGSGLLGMLRWRQRDVPLVDPTPVLGCCGSLQSAPWVAVAQAGDLFIALPCHGMDQVRRFERSKVQRGDPALCGSACAGIVLQADGQQIRLVDTAALVNSFPVSTISRQAAGTDRATTAASRNREAHVVFQARSRFAAPIHQLKEIMPLPADWGGTVQAGGTAGSIEWRGQALPLIDLQQRLWPGVRPTTALRRILITQMGERLAGLLVGEVEVLIPPLAGVQTQISLPNGDRMGMITVEEDGARTSYRLIDFDTLAATA